MFTDDLAACRCIQMTKLLVNAYRWPSCKSMLSNRVGPNSEYGPNTEYRIIRFLKILRIPNTELFGFWIWTNTEYRIALFGLNYSNTEYLKSNSSPPKNLICEFCDQMRWGKFDPLFSYLHERFLLCFLHISFL